MIRCQLLRFLHFRAPGLFGDVPILMFIPEKMNLPTVTLALLPGSFSDILTTPKCLTISFGFSSAGQEVEPFGKQSCQRPVLLNQQRSCNCVQLLHPSSLPMRISLPGLNLCVFWLQPSSVHFLKQKLNEHKINDRSNYSDLHKLEDIFIDFCGPISTREDI